MKQETRNLKPNTGNSPAISVIVPIYNMEKLMRKCLDSILAQTFEDYECLLVDDGSKDGSPAICDEYAAKDPRFKAFHKPNGGLSDARNYGIERAQGDYTIFFDPDDWVDANCLKDMYAKAKETFADMVICDYFNQDPYRVQYTKQVPESLDHNDVLKDVVIGNLYGYTWNKLLKRDLYQIYELQYPVGMYGCEDQYTMCKLLKNDIKIAYLPKAYYHYMHYGNATQSRRYDENTYQHDVKIRDMFVELLTGTPLRQLAYEKKTFAILYRAYHFGGDSISSKEFKEKYSTMSPLINKYGGAMTPLYKLAIRGHYRFSKKIFQVGFDLKQLIKKIINR